MSASTTDPDADGLVPLGDGPVAAVLAGVDATTGEAYALKVFPGPLDRRVRAELDDELGRLAALRTRAPILVADRVETRPDGRCALRMELCAQSLPDLLDSFGPLSVPDALVLGTVLAAALATAHGAGLVHGGVTPGNVLFRPSGEPVLSDFGRVPRHAFPRDPLPTVELMAPETVRDGSMDERTDLYGLGVILHLALSGRLPHHGRPGEEQGERLLRVLGTPVPPLAVPDAPPDLVMLVSELLAKDPHQRPADAVSVAQRLDVMRQRAAQPEAEAAQPDAEAAQPDAEAAQPDAEATPPDAPGPEGSPQQAPLPHGKPILVFGPTKSSGRARRGALLSAAVAVAALLAVAAALLVARQPDERAVSAPPAGTGTPTPTPTSARDMRLELADPTDRGNVVELSWHSSEPLDFAVIVAAEGEPAEVRVVQRATSYRVRVDPVRKYCFQIQGSDGVHVLESEAKPIRGARCAT
jgi:hypothetical protein